VPSRSTRDLAGLTLVLAIAVSIALFWVVRVPVFQEPDEMAHADYVFALYDAVSPFVVSRPRPDHEVAPQTRYLRDAVGYRRMRYNPVAQPPQGYDSRDYFEQLDRGAPAPSRRTPSAGSSVPYVMVLYPVTYYAAVLLALRTAIAATHSLALGFFAMRAVGVLALGVTLVCGYLAMRAYAVRASTALLATLGLGTFPLMTALSSSVQPDTLVTAFFALTLLGAALLRSRATRVRGEICIGLALLGLAMTKQHYAAAAWLVTVPLVFVRQGRERNWLSLALIALLPVAGYIVAYSFIGPVHGVQTPTQFATSSHAASGVTGGDHTVELLANALRSCIDGTVAHTFWNTFGYRAGRIFPGAAADLVIPVIDVVLVVAFALAQYVILSRIANVAMRRSPSRAFALIVGGHPTNIAVIVSIVLVAANVASAGLLELQGRYWIPIALALVLIALRTYPRLVAAKERARFSAGLGYAMGAYALVAAPTAAIAMNAYFYALPERPHFETVADVNVPDTMTIARPKDVRIDGFAIDMLTGEPATNVVARVDGGADVHASAYGLPTPSVAHIFNDADQFETGFRIVIPAKLLSPGVHTVAFFVGNVRTTAIPFRRRIVLRVG
jgi:hypothetical protein